MNDGAPSLEVGLEITTGGSFAALAQLAALADTTEAKVVRNFVEMERAAGGSMNLAAATTSITTFGNAATRVEQDVRREKAATEAAIDRMVKKLDRQTAAVGRTREEQQLARIEELGVAAARQDNTDAADRLLVSVRALGAAQDALAEDRLAAETKATAAATREREQAEAALVAQLLERSRLEAALDRTNGKDRSPAVQSGATYSALTTKFLEDEAQAAREAALAHDLFNAAVRRGAQAMREAEAAEQQLIADARQLRAALDPMFAAQQRFDGEMERAERLLAAGAIGQREYGAAVQLARDNLYAHAQAATGNGKALERLTQQQQQAVGSIGAQRAAMQGLGYQAQDTFTQLSMGGNVFSVLAIQGGQAAGAFAYAGGKMQAFASFMLGPWGLAITGGLLVLGALTKGLFENEEAAKAAEKAMAAFASYEENVGSFIDKTTGKLIEQNAQLVLNARLLKNNAADASRQSSLDLGNKAFDAAQRAAKFTVVSGGTVSTSQTYTDPKVAAAIAGAKGSAVILSQNLSALAATDARYKSLATTVSDYAAKAAFANRSMHEQRGEALELTDAMRNGGVQTAASVRAQVEIATASDGVSRARANLSQIQADGDRIDKMVYGPAKLAALAKYRTELTSANKAVAGAEEAKRAAAAANRAETKDANRAEKLGRDADAVAAQIKNTYALADAYTASGAEALIAEARVKAMSAAIKAQGDVEATVSRQVQLAIAQRVADAEKSVASLREQARIQAEVNGMVAAGSLPAERAAELVQQRMAELPLLAAIEAAQQRGLKDEAEKATKALDDQRAAQVAAKAADYGKQANNDDAAAAKQLATLREEARLIGATEQVRTHDLATLKAQQEAAVLYGSTTNAFAKIHIANQVEIADLTLANKNNTDALNASLTETADHWDMIATKVQSAGQSMADAFGSAGRAIGDLASIYADYQATRAHLDEERQAVLNKYGADSKQAELANQKYALQTSGLQAAAFAEAAGAAKSLFAEHSAGYQAMAAAEKALAAWRAIQAVRDVAAGAAKMFASLGPLGFAAVAAMVAVMAGFGISGGGGSSVKPPSADDLQKAAGTGTVLGSPDGKSASIAHSLDLVAKNTADDLGIGNAMLASLKAINTSIVAMAATVGKQISVNGSLGDTSKLNLGSSGSAGFVGLFASSTTRSLYDAGITLAATTVGNIVASGITGQTYQIVEQVKKSSGFLGIGGGTKTTYQTSTGALPSDISASIQSVIGALENGIVAAAGAIGNNGAKAMLDSFTVDIGKLSFNGLDAQGIQDQLNAVFSSVGDKMVKAILPGIERFQHAGEGLFETLERVASTVVAVDAEMAKLGVSATGLGVDIAMGIASKFDSVSDFTSAADSYFKSYYSAAEQTAAKTSQMAKAFDGLGLTMPTSLAGFRQLVEAQDLTTSAGQSTYATLLQLAPAFADLNTTMDGAKSAADIASERADLQKQLWQALGDSASIRAAELAEIDPSNRALKQRLYDLADEAAAMEAANRVAQERTGLQSALNQLLGDTAAMRVEELAALDPANRALKLQIYALQDQQAAAAAAAQAEQEAAQAAAAVAQERKGIEQQLLQLQGKTAELRQRELALLDPTNRALQQQVYDLTDLQAAQAAAAAVAQERTGLESQLLQLQNDTVALRARELAELDPTNRALQEQIYALTDLQAAQAAATQAAQEAAQAAAAIAQERAGIEQQLLQLQGKTAELRDRELAGLDASNRALMEQVYALQDQQAATQAASQAAQEAAQAEQAIAQERAGLMQQLWQLTGDTASIRAAALAALDPSNRALQEQIYAISDAQDAAKAAQALADAWKTVGDSIMDEITRIRGLGTTGGASFASLQGQFNAAVTAARGGDQDAAKGLPELSKSLLDAAALAATSRQELARVEAQTAGALQSVYDMIGSAVGASGAATSAVLGTAVSNDNASASGAQWWTTFANTASAASAGGGNDDLVSEIRELRAEVAGMRAENNKGHANTATAAEKGSNALDRASRLGGGSALATVKAA